MKRSVVGLLCVSVALLVVVAGGCGKVGFTSGSATDAASIDALEPAVLGAIGNPARTCAELQVAGMPSAAYWLRDTDETRPPFQVYCEQELNGGGWAMLENSVRRDDGTTTAFWQFGWDDRLKQRGTLATDQNYYDGSLYLLGTQYMDVFVDLQGTTGVAALMTATGINSKTMELLDSQWIGGNVDVYEDQFAAGWSAKDRDMDTHLEQNCAAFYADVAQHYSHCWSYSLGADAEEDANGSYVDGGVGPHVANEILTSLGLALQAEGGEHSQVKRIARFARW
jgi:hypothetical protein